jgi:hypothetical protein
MAHFSDRFISTNKLIIAAAVAYAGFVTFAHAGEPKHRLTHDQALNVFASHMQCAEVGGARFHRGELSREELDGWVLTCFTGKVHMNHGVPTLADGVPVGE